MDESFNKPLLRKEGGPSISFEKSVQHPVLNRISAKKRGKTSSSGPVTVRSGLQDSLSGCENPRGDDPSSDENPSISNKKLEDETTLSANSKVDDSRTRTTVAETADSVYFEGGSVLLSPETSNTDSVQTVVCDISEVTVEGSVARNSLDSSTENFRSVIPDVTLSSSSASQHLPASKTSPMTGAEQTKTAHEKLLSSTSSHLALDMRRDYESVSDDQDSKSNSTGLTSFMSKKLKSLKKKEFSGKDDGSLIRKMCSQCLQPFRDYDALPHPPDACFPNDTEKQSTSKQNLGSSALTAGPEEELKEKIECEAGSASIGTKKLQKQKDRVLSRASSAPLLDESDATFQRRIVGHDNFGDSITNPKVAPHVQNGTDDHALRRTSEDLYVAQSAAQVKDLLEAWYADVAKGNRKKLEDEAEQLLQKYLQLLYQNKNLESEVKKLEEYGESLMKKHEEAQKSKQARDAKLKKSKAELSAARSQLKYCEERNKELVESWEREEKALDDARRSKETQLRDVESQRRKAESVIREKEKEVVKLKEEVEMLTTNLKEITVKKAKSRGRNAEEVLTQQACKYALKRAPITAIGKRLDLSIASSGSKPVMLNKNKALSKEVPNATLTSSFVPHSSVASASNVSQKGIRWDTPLVAASSGMQSLCDFQKDAHRINIDMQLMQTEENEFGKSMLYCGSNGDFVVRSETLCGCSMFEYSNKDVQWIHSSRQYYVYHVGQTGTTIANMLDGLLIKHFSNGQLEFYSDCGLETVVHPTGEWVEILREGVQNDLQQRGFRVQIVNFDEQVVRLVHNSGRETVLNAKDFLPFSRRDGSSLSYSPADQSLEFRGRDYIVWRSKNGNVKAQFELLNTIVSILMTGVGKVEHSSNVRGLPNQCCVEWGGASSERWHQVAMIANQYNHAVLQKR